jgi:DNA-binding response OmpR family regulator
VLLVDDEPHIGRLLEPQLEERGHRVTLAHTLAQARAIMAGHPVDAVLLDVHLPDGSGLDWLRELREAPRTRALPVVVLTAEGEERIHRAAEQLGATVLTKPFSPSKLATRVGDMLGTRPGSRP